MNEDEKRRRKLEIARKEAEWRDSPGSPVPEHLPALQTDADALGARVARLEALARTSATRIGALVLIALLSSAATVGLAGLLWILVKDSI